MSNEPFENSENPSDVEPDMDFAEFEDQKESQSLKSALKENPRLKLALVAAGVIGILGAIVLFGGSEKKGPNSYVASGSDIKQTPGTEQVSPAMQEAIEENDKQVLEKAVKEGRSAMPTPIAPPKALLAVPTDEAQQEDPLVRWRQLQEERLRIQREQEQAAKPQVQQTDPKRDQMLQTMMGSMAGQMQQVLESQKLNQQKYIKVTDMNQLRQAAATATANAAASAATTAAAQQTATPELQKVMISAGTINYGQLLIEANSDVQGPVVALLVSGPFNGSRVMGTFTRQEDKLVIQFNSVTGKDGNSIPIQAYAVDPETTLTGMASEVDHRYFERIILPAAAKFVEGMGSAIANSGTTTTSVSSGGQTTTTQDNSKINTKQEVYKGIEEAASQVGDVLTNDSKNKQPLVIVHAGTAIGILFTAPVTEQTVKKSRYVPTQQDQQAQANGQPNQQGQYGLPVNAFNPMSSIQALQQSIQAQQMLQQQGGYAQPGAAQLNVNTTGTTTKP